MLCWFLAVPVAIIARACATEEICREPREFCLRRHEFYRQRCHESCDVSLAARTTAFALQKLFYVPTCEYCLSFWISLAVVLVADYRMFFDDWRGVALACFVVMGVANVYLSLFSNLRVDSRKDRAIADTMEKNDIKRGKGP